MSAPPRSSPRLLLIEDEESLQELLQSFLAEEGSAVTVAGSLAEALALVQTAPFDLLLTDLFADQRADALASIAELRAVAQPTPVVVMTGWPIPAEEAAEHGLTVLVTKPFDLEDLGSIIASCLHQPLRAEDTPQATAVEQFLAALEQHDVETLLTLCHEDIRFYPPANTPTASSEVIGRAAYRQFVEASLARFAEVHFRDHQLYPAPQGDLALRYTFQWRAQDGTQQQRTAGTRFQFVGARISQIGLPVPTRRVVERIGIRLVPPC